MFYPTLLLNSIFLALLGSPLFNGLSASYNHKLLKNERYKCCLLFHIFVTFAGTPPTTAFSGTFFETAAPAAITAPSPMVTPGSIVAFEPIQTLHPILIGRGRMSARREGSNSWFKVANTTLCPISVPSPIVSSLVLHLAPAVKENVFAYRQIFSAVRIERREYL